VTTWLHRIVVNACLDLLRRRSVRRAEPLPDDLDQADRGSLRTADDALDPADLSVRRERADLVHAALLQLPLEQRAAVVLVDMEGYPVAEVAAILDCAVGTVKSRCSRARARLSVLLTELLDPDPDPGPETHLTPTSGNPPTGPYVGSETPRGPPSDPSARPTH
jgi:RNA polymerase sigma-70 factor (ECF subfamily)